ncbi:hypothetical protein D9615_004534 [Tricholomella constricta]|uniref:XPG-I domain-containing protein n=1 Tax=Tricholomella constricta TaxID=117010 RepID=A0A8H5M451_9AGAR|nr:hypothetical protein D9615_004534 [Tricholomella constricta]
MGIPGLWKILKPTVQARTLTQLSVSEGFEHNRRATGTIRVGIDASLLLNRAQWAAYHQTGRGINMQAGENLPLQILFFQLCRLLALPIIPIFAFDGSQGPTVKRGRQVKATPHALMSAFLQLINDAGFYGYTAPGEAEAELAELNARGEIDAVITDDVDAFLFGATHVIRTSNVVRDGDYISIYTASAIKAHPSTQLTSARVLLIAILTGGDYMPGLKGCGMAIAHRLSIRTSLADGLYAATRDLPPHQLPGFLRGWRDALKTQLTQDPDNVLGRRYPAIAQNLSEDFPSIDVLRYYLYPITSGPGGEVNVALQKMKPPDLPALAVWCEKYFSWASRGVILERFRSNLWSGIFIRSLIKPINVDTVMAAHVNEGYSESRHPAILQITRASLGPGAPSTRPNVWGYHVQVEPHLLVVSTLSRLTPEDRTAAESQPRKTLIIWIPASILKRALPKLVEAFHMARGTKITAAPVTPLLSAVGHNDIDTGADSGDVSDTPSVVTNSSSLRSSANISSWTGSGSMADPIIFEDGDIGDCDSDESGDGGKEIHIFGPQTRLQFLFESLDAIL